jgi:hypothetical protein
MMTIATITPKHPALEVERELARWKSTTTITGMKMKNLQCYNLKMWTINSTNISLNSLPMVS